MMIAMQKKRDANMREDVNISDRLFLQGRYYSISYTVLLVIHLSPLPFSWPHSPTHHTEDDASRVLGSGSDGKEGASDRRFYKHREHPALTSCPQPHDSQCSTSVSIESHTPQQQAVDSKQRCPNS